MTYALQRGFSLLELMIVVAISGILATVMFSSYHNHIRKSRRTEALQTLMSIQLAQERYRATNTTYGTLSNVWSGVTTTSDGYYNLSVSNLSGTSYTLTATATGDQANDAENGTGCGTVTLTMSNGTETKTPATCW